ncbi:hypothetical protein E0Z10_g7889 [Xylaria hypoxylon]|uniref:Uncharacterized protein n=1 Tax=Xylaria hypoxylon TaxID=37992 RepID=A0A4Z0YCS3_9PEZI|nr:hypothetical protein E0Z10_g7889 [Xylaria hypoxylon]
MGNNSSVPSALPTPTHTSTHSSHTFSSPHRSISVSPLKPSTFVSITKASSKSSSHGPSLTRTDEYCTWDWEKETSSCSLLTFTADVPNPFTIPTPTGGYETSEASFSFPHYTCTDLICIDSVASDYGYSLCLATSPTDFWPPAETWSWSEASTTDEWETITPTCDPVFDWENCPGPTPKYSDSLSEVWPTLTWDWPTETSSDCDTTESSVKSSTSAENCEFDVDCWTSVHYTIQKSRHTPSATITKHSYSYRSTSTKRTSTSTTSDCDFWDEDCTPAPTGEPTTWEWNPDPWTGHTVSTKVPSPRQSAEAKK